MANEVKLIVKEIIINSTNEEVSIDEIFETNSDFNPEYITKKLELEPYDSRKMGTPRKYGRGKYTFSDWSACKQTEPALDVEEQCMKIVNMLKDKVSLLLDIKKEFDVTFCINIVPHIVNEETPGIAFNKYIIEFCYLTGTEIGVDIYVCGDS